MNKFNIGQKVYYFENGYIYEAKVYEIQWSGYDGGSAPIKYSTFVHIKEGRKFKTLDEHELASNKEILLKMHREKLKNQYESELVKLESIKKLN